MIYKKGTCCNCGDEDVFLVKRTKEGRWCNGCNKDRLLGKKEPVKKQVVRRAYKPSGELLLFNMIWSTRKHVSFVSGEYLGEELKPIFFSHLLPKSHYGKFRLLDRNIILLSSTEHSLWHQDRGALRGRPEWKKVFALYEELKQEYFRSS